MAAAKVYVQSAYITADTDEEKGRSKIVVDFTLSCAVTVYEKEELSVVDDAFSPELYLTLKQKNEATRYALNAETVTERIHGTPILEAKGDLAGKTPSAVVFPRVSIELKETNGETQFEGIIEGKVLYQGEDGSCALAKLSLPFLLPTAFAVGCEVDCSVYGLSIRVRAGGEMEAEATLKMRVTPFERWEVSYADEVVEGEVRQPPTAGVSVYMTVCGDGLWETAKRLCVSPEQLEQENPELCFPLKGEERLVIYRQNTQILQK
jgi:hypothetical protein